MGTVALVYMDSLEGDTCPSLDVFSEFGRGELSKDAVGEIRDDELSSLVIVASLGEVAKDPGFL